MIRSTCSKVLLAFGLVYGSLFVSGCSGGDAAPEREATAAGTLSLPLLTNSGGHTYRLEGALYVNGPTYVYLDVNSEAEVLTTSLPTGEYTAFLYSWTLTRDDGAGGFVPVAATLVSSNSPSFSIFNQTTTAVSFDFETDSQIVTVGAGGLNVAVHVDETPAICTPLGAGCAEGTWCAPSELTGSQLSCIPEGPIALGAPCDSPRDCAANSSCFDFGTGAVCAALCESADFEQPCVSGGTCTAQGIDYGVCRPDAAAP